MCFARTACDELFLHETSRNRQKIPKVKYSLSYSIVYFMTVEGFLQRDTDQLLIKAEQEALDKAPHVKENDTRHINSENNRTENTFQLQELIVRIDTLESDMTTNVAENSKELKNNSERLTRLEAVGSNTKIILDTSNETLQDSCVTLITLNDTVMTNEANIDKQNESLSKLEAGIELHETRLAKLEKSIDKQNETIDRLDADIELHETRQNQTIDQMEANIEFYETRLAQIETRVILENVTLETQSFELAKLHSDQLNDRSIITNHTSRILRLEIVDAEKQTSTIELDNRLVQLVSDTDKAQADIKDNSFNIRLLKENVTVETTIFNNQITRINELESKLNSIQNSVKDYNGTVETIKVTIQFFIMNQHRSDIPLNI